MRRRGCGPGVFSRPVFSRLSCCGSIGFMPELFYQDDSATIYRGDAVDVMRQLDVSGPDGFRRSAHMVLTDPPYFRVLKGCDWDDQWGPKPAAFHEWLGVVLGGADRLLADRGTLAVFCSPHQACATEQLVRDRFGFMNHVVWAKPHGRLGRANRSAFRQFWPTSERIIFAEKRFGEDSDPRCNKNNADYMAAREAYAPIRLMLADSLERSGLAGSDVNRHLGTQMASHYFSASQWALPTADVWQKLSDLFATRNVQLPDYVTVRAEYDELRTVYDNIRREFDPFNKDVTNKLRALELCSDVWRFDPPPRSKRQHPAQKPEPLIEHMIRTCTRPGDLIIDPFIGSGTTLQVAKRLGRRSVGVDKDAHWCEVAAERLKQETLPL